MCVPVLFLAEVHLSISTPSISKFGTVTTLIQYNGIGIHFCSTSYIHHTFPLTLSGTRKHFLKHLDRIRLRRPQQILSMILRYQLQICGFTVHTFTFCCRYSIVTYYQNHQFIIYVPVLVHRWCRFCQCSNIFWTFVIISSSSQCSGTL